MVLGDKVETGLGIDPARVTFFDAVYAKLGMKSLSRLTEPV
jgi:hypothetical protein